MNNKPKPMMSGVKKSQRHQTRTATLVRCLPPWAACFLVHFVLPITQLLWVFRAENPLLWKTEKRNYNGIISCVNTF